MNGRYCGSLEHITLFKGGTDRWQVGKLTLKVLLTDSSEDYTFDCEDAKIEAEEPLLICNVNV